MIELYVSTDYGKLYNGDTFELSFNETYNNSKLIFLNSSSNYDFYQPFS